MKTRIIDRKFLYLWIDKESGMVKIRCVYNEGFIKEMKETIPYEHRKWDKVNKLWMIEPDYYGEIIEIGRKYFDVVKKNVLVEQLGSEFPTGEEEQIKAPEILRKIRKVKI